MAEIIPELNKQTLSRMTSGERRVARRLKDLLEDDYLVWYDIPVGRHRRYPDFIILHPGRGLLFLEVKDWKSETIKKINKSDVTLLTNDGLVTKPHPLEQARQYTYNVVNLLLKDPSLRQTSQAYKGNLIMPWGWGCVFTNITRKKIQKTMSDEARDMILPDHLMLYKDEISDSVDAETFQEQLWGMFNYRFGGTLTLPQIERIRWHLFPEIRIDEKGSVDDIFDEEDESSHSGGILIPDIIRVMDVQQEQLARSLGEGHRVIHGVAGSGKTLILGYRCLHLARFMSKPILVLCFNITLAARLRSFISSKGIGTQVQIYHFHDWCAQQLRTYHVELTASKSRDYWDLQVEAIIEAVEKGRIPRAQYGAILIDEGHDFEAEWLKLISQMVDPETNSLLLLYDDAQSIYKKQSGLGFTLSSVGIQAQGRTTILRLNYRNTKEILQYAYDFARHYIDPQSTDDDHIPLIEPEAAGSSGPEPVLKEFSNCSEEIDYVLGCIKKWNQADGVALKDIAVIYSETSLGESVAPRLKQEGIDHLLANDQGSKSSYNPEAEQVTLMTIHSSKGLEFRRVILIGMDRLGKGDDEARIAEDARLLYVGMTRAQEGLLITGTGEGRFSQQLGKNGS